jgi:hypothetical protein
MALSPQTLFHFTNRKSYLFGILKNGFKLSYAREEILTKNDNISVRIPMVSFCDLKLSEIKDHIKSYGNYGIGLKKEWARKQGLNPVWYLSMESPQCKTVLSLLKKIENKFINNEIGMIPEGISSSSYSLLNYIKNYEGPLKRENREIKNIYRFADEREWRYCLPANYSNPNFKINKFGGIERSTEDKKVLNKRIESLRLDFKPEDISYIIVKNNKDVTSLHKFLEDNSTFIDPKFIQSRILTSDQIKNDF